MSGRTPRRTSSGSTSAALRAQRDGNRAAFGRVALDAREGVVEIGGLLVDVARLQAEIDAALLAFDVQRARARQRRGERLRAAHAAEAGGQHPAAFEIAAVMLAPGFDEGLVGALHDALAADVDPAAGRHLAVHREALRVEFVEVLPARPVRHEIRIRDQHARRVLVRLEHADRLARLHEQRFVGFEALERLDDLVVARPVARRPADAAVHHQFLRILGHFGVEIVHQHAQRRFGQPALGVERGAARRADFDIAKTGRLVHHELLRLRVIRVSGSAAIRPIR